MARDLFKKLKKTKNIVDKFIVIFYIEDWRLQFFLNKMRA